MKRGFTLIALAGAMTALTLTVGSAAGSPGADSQIATKASLLSTTVDPLQEELAIDAMASSTSNGTKHYGPFPSMSPDSGTCGNDWAEDTFDRFFTVRQTGAGTYEVYEQFKNGTFVTMAGPSPGACDLSDGYGPGVVSGGLLGTMHGYFIIEVTCALAAPCFNAAGSCGACDTTAGFIAAFFGPTAAYNVGTYFFHYAGYDGTNQALIVHEWKNASCDRGGNHGDIATASMTGPQALTC
ncbi:MAG: hypothetical protein QOK32_1163 [Gaiellaceae bacterium]|nr:hypothetical protein [Gaiellaceae bacterium]